MEKITLDGNMDSQRSQRISDLKKGKSQPTNRKKYGVFTELANYVYLHRVFGINHLVYGLVRTTRSLIMLH